MPIFRSGRAICEVGGVAVKTRCMPKVVLQEPTESLELVPSGAANRAAA